MKKLVFAAVIALFSIQVYAADGHSPDHAKHNMVLFGTETIFASHIVYKEPHNFQVILSVNLDEDSRKKYLIARNGNPNALFVFLLDPLDIKNISNIDVISGAIFYRDKNDERHDVVPSVKLSKKDFNVIYFDELPLSLEKESREQPYFGEIL